MGRHFYGIDSKGQAYAFSTLEDLRRFSTITDLKQVERKLALIHPVISHVEYLEGKWVITKYKTENWF